MLTISPTTIISIAVCKFPGMAFFSRFSLESLFCNTRNILFYHICPWQRKKLTILQYSAILHVGIVLFEKKTHQIPKPSQPWWSRSPDTEAWQLHRANILAVPSL
jgi:hypothetical protein